MGQYSMTCHQSPDTDQNPNLQERTISPRKHPSDTETFDYPNKEQKLGPSRMGNAFGSEARMTKWEALQAKFDVRVGNAYGSETRKALVKLRTETQSAPGQLETAMRNATEK